MALAFHTGWAYLPGEDEPGSVLTDCFLEMAADNRKRFEKVWDKQKQQLLQILPKEEEKEGLLYSAISVTATEECDGKWLPCDTRMYFVSNGGDLFWFGTMADIRLTFASLGCVVHRKGLYAWMTACDGKSGEIPLSEKHGEEVEHPVFRWRFPDLCNGMEECRFRVLLPEKTLQEDPVQKAMAEAVIYLSDENSRCLMKQERTPEGLWWSAGTPQFAENGKGTKYEICLEAAAGEPFWETFSGELALQEEAWKEEYKRCLPFGRSLEENACFYMACDRILARDCKEVTLEYRESFVTEENLPPEENKKQYDKMYKKYPWLEEYRRVGEEKAVETVWEYFDGKQWCMIPQSREWKTGCKTEDKTDGGKKRFTWAPPKDREACSIDGETHFYLRLRLLVSKQAHGMYYRRQIPVLEEICLSVPARKWMPAKQVIPKAPECGEEWYLGFDRPISSENKWCLKYRGTKETGEEVWGQTMFSFQDRQLEGEAVRFGEKAFWVKMQDTDWNGIWQIPLKEVSVRFLPNYVEIREEPQNFGAKLWKETGEESIGMSVNAGKYGMLDARTVKPVRRKGGNVSLTGAGKSEEEMGRFGRLVTFMDVETWLTQHFPCLEKVNCSWREETEELFLLCYAHEALTKEQEKEIREALEDALRKKGSLWLSGCRIVLEICAANEAAGESEEGKAAKGENIRLDDSSYEEIYERAKSRLTKQAPWWTHRGLSDPGITLLEMWAILSDMQSFYLDQMQESHYRKYRKLLGITPEEGSYAKVQVFFNQVPERICLPEGTKIRSGAMCFETAEEIILTDNRLKAFYLPEEGAEERNRIYTMTFWRKTSFPLPEGERLFSFELEHPVRAGEELRFFVALDETAGRNPAPEGYRMARLSWEYWTKEGYCRARILRDDTRGLLYSGTVVLGLDKQMEKTKNGGYAVRCSIEEGAYDILPVLYRIWLNAVPALQKETLCREDFYSLAQGEKEIKMHSYLAQTGKVRIYGEREEGLWEDFTDSCEIDPPITRTRRERYIRFGGQEFCRLKIVSYEADFLEKQEEIHITGVSMQQIPLLWDCLKRDQVKFMLRQGTGSALYREYRRAEPEEECRYGWHFLEENTTVELGDGRHGQIPQPAQDGLCFCSLVLWEGRKGNIAIDRISRLERPELFANITCRNFMTGRGGRDRKKPSEQFSELLHDEKKCFRQERMVTGEDFRSLAMETPGLVLQDVRVKWAEDTVTVTIFPGETLKKPYCVEKYVSEVQKHLEPYRLAGCAVRVQLGREAYK